MRAGHLTPFFFWGDARPDLLPLSGGTNRSQMFGAGGHTTVWRACVMAGRDGSQT